jgi:PAS domain S-box-containing protein
MARILIIDDRAANRDVVRTMLGYKQHQIVEAGDGSEGLRIARTERPDLVICDILMPTMDGFEFVRQLREDASMKATPVVFSTAHFLNDGAKALAQSCGVQFILSKPVEPELMLRTVDMALRGRASEQPPVGAEAFSREHLQLLTDQLAQKVDVLRAANQRMAALMELGRQIGVEPNPRALLKDLCRAARVIVGARFASVGAVDDSGSPLPPLVYSGIPELPDGDAAGAPGPDTLIGKCVVTRQAYRATEFAGDLRIIGLPATHPPANFAICAPIMSPTRAYGWICLAEKVGLGRFTDHDVDLVANLAAQVGRAYENAILFERVQQRAAELEREAAERKRTEAALRESEQRFRMMADTMPGLLWMSDEQGNCVFVNKQWLELTRRPLERELGSGFLDSIHPEDVDKFRETHMTAFAGRQAYETEYRLRGRDGQFHWFLDIGSPRFDSDGQYLGHISLLIDVTERRQLESQLRQAQKMEAVGQLTGGIAHDFNNLLTVILGNVSLLASQLPAHDPSRDSIAAAEQAAQRAANLTKQLLGFSRHAFVRSEPTDVKGIMDEVTTLLSRTIDPRISIEVQCAADVWRVHSDPSQMSQILMNLCLNARDAMPEGGRLRLEAHNVTLTPDDVRWQLDGRPGEFVRLRVSDTGHGMTPEIRARIFEPFFTTKEPGRGTGLGLAMVFGIVRRHQGWINCDSEVGRGTRFDLYLPRFREDAACAEAMSAPAPPTQGTETILIAEDEPLIRRLTATVLASLGYQVFAAEDGQEAVEIFQREHGQIDLVLLDLTMPRLSGRDAFRRLRELDPHVRVLFTSGYSEEHVTDAEQEYVLGFISKPYRPEELAKTVRRILDHHRRREKTQAALAGS